MVAEAAMASSHLPERASGRGNAVQRVGRRLPWLRWCKGGAWSSSLCLSVHPSVQGRHMGQLIRPSVRSSVCMVACLPACLPAQGRHMERLVCLSGSCWQATRPASAATPLSTWRRASAGKAGCGAARGCGCRKGRRQARRRRPGPGRRHGRRSGWSSRCSGRGGAECGDGHAGQRAAGVGGAAGATGAGGGSASRAGRGEPADPGGHPQREMGRPPASSEWDLMPRRQPHHRGGLTEAQGALWQWSPSCSWRLSSWPQRSVCLLHGAPV
jgi:hypothetical protein